LNLTALFFLVTTIVCLLVIAYLKFKQKKFTRARFAFIALGTFVSFGMFSVAAVTSSGPVQLVIGGMNALFGSTLPTGQPGTLDKAFVFAVLFMVYLLISKFYDNWDGPKTVEQVEWEKQHFARPLLIEGAAEVKRMVSGRKAELYDEVSKGLEWDKMSTPNYQLIWHQHCRELIELSSPRHVFDENDGWHDLQDCWFSSNQRTNGVIAIYCPSEQPQVTDIIEAIAYINSQLSGNQTLERVFVISHEAIEGFALAQYPQVELKMENQLLDGIVNFSDYKRQLDALINKTALPNSELTLSQTYTPSNITDREKKPVDVNLDQYLQTWIDDESAKKHIALLGECGQGKSSAMQMLSNRMITDKAATRIPILIELRGKSPKNLHQKSYWQHGQYLSILTQGR
jgi:hypothetical protein